MRGIGPFGGCELIQVGWNTFITTPITDGMFDPAYRDWFGKCDGCGKRGVLVLRDFVKIERLCARCCDEE